MFRSLLKSVKLKYSVALGNIYMHFVRKHYVLVLQIRSGAKWAGRWVGLGGRIRCRTVTARQC